MTQGERFPRSVRLRRRGEFLVVQKQGRRVHTPHFVILVHPRPVADRTVRLGITVSRRVGDAVRRNRIKRFVREAFRRKKAAFPPGHDVVVVAKPGAATLAAREVEAELGSLGRGRRRA